MVCIVLINQILIREQSTNQLAAHTMCHETRNRRQFPEYCTSKFRRLLVFILRRDHHNGSPEPVPNPRSKVSLAPAVVGVVVVAAVGLGWIDVLISCHPGVFEGGGSAWEHGQGQHDVAADAPVLRMAVLHVTSDKSTVFFANLQRGGVKMYVTRRSAKHSQALQASPTSQQNLGKVRGAR